MRTLPCMEKLLVRSSWYIALGRYQGLNVPHEMRHNEMQALISKWRNTGQEVAESRVVGADTPGVFSSRAIWVI